jgi:hypothetical protein
MPMDAFLPSMTLFEGVAKIRDGAKKKAKWKPRHLVLDLLGQLNCYRPKGKSGKERGDKVEMVIDIARYGEEIRVGALAHAETHAQWPKKAGSPGCCLSLITSANDKTWYMMLKTPELAGALGTAIHRFKPQLVVAALPGTISGEFDKNHFGGTGSFSASPTPLVSDSSADDNWEANDDEDEEEDKKLGPIPNLSITTKFGKLSAQHIGQRVEVKPPSTQVRVCARARTPHARLPRHFSVSFLDLSAFFCCSPHTLFLSGASMPIPGRQTQNLWRFTVLRARPHNKDPTLRHRAVRTGG